MAVSRTGTAVQIDASGADSGSSSGVTVPADATAVVAKYSYWDDNSNVGAPAFDFDGTDTFTSQAHLSDAVNQNAVGVQVLILSSTGSRTFNWDWAGATGARSEGGLIVLTFVKGVDTSSIANLVRGTDIDQSQAGSGPLSISSNTTDLVLAMAQAYSQDPGIDGTKYIANVAVNSDNYDVSEVTAGATTTTVSMTSVFFTSLVGISLREATAGSSIDIIQTLHDPDAGFGAQSSQDLNGLIQ